LNIFEAVLLGLIQGITEFLPISSTGHVTLAGKFLGLISESDPQRWTSFAAVIQLGTLIAVAVYFWGDIVTIVQAFFRENISERKNYAAQSISSRMGWMVIIGSLPVAIVGLLFKHQIEGVLTKNLYVIAISLIALAVILGIAEKTAKFKKGLKEVSVKDAIVVGIAQAFALIPGSSRSGTTLTGGLFMGLNRETAARFSFLLSIPAVFASGLLELKEAIHAGLNQADILNYVIATIIAGLSGYFAIDFLLRYLRKNTTFIFVFYRIILGVGILLLLHYQIILP
jgi:undecaprenyl-diphosphatase